MLGKKKPPGVSDAIAETSIRNERFGSKPGRLEAALFRVFHTSFSKIYTSVESSVLSFA